MRRDPLQVLGYSIPVYAYNTVIVGSGAAGLCAAERLHAYGQQDLAIVTEGINTGTSRNTGSDKQTYYKLTLSGGTPDSVYEMADTLFQGQCVDWEHALCEAALSAQCFYHLVDLGVPFPQNRYGEYVGYKTDHDPRQRATSAGPYTSKMMTEQLEEAVVERQIPIHNKLQAIRILTGDGRAKGLLCLDLNRHNKAHFIVFLCKNIVYATGGPAGMYADSVYPSGHLGATGIAFEAGVRGKNLTEWQYGLASINPRWNVSGTYMQVLPRFLSTDIHGGEEREFLYEYFEDERLLLDCIFLKGYQWPFDVRKIQNGSSMIDLLVYHELQKGRRIFLDFRTNPGDQATINFSPLCREAQTYLDKAGACFGTPVERLCHMNQPAFDFYKSRGVDLSSQLLEISLCAQHNNGGLEVDLWWQTNLTGFFAVGEAAATHGVYRPGGSALNAGQVGAFRAAQYIAHCRRGEPDGSVPVNQIEKSIQISKCIFNNHPENVSSIWNSCAKKMSLYGGPVRHKLMLDECIKAIQKQLDTFCATVHISSYKSLGKAYRLYDMLLCQYIYLSAMKNYIESGGKSRGSALYTNSDNTYVASGVPGDLGFRVDDDDTPVQVQTVEYSPKGCSFDWRDVHPVAPEDNFFENIWRDFRSHGNTF